MNTDNLTAISSSLEVIKTENILNFQDEPVKTLQEVLIFVKLNQN